MQLDLVSFSVTAPGAGPTAMAAVTGDSAIIRNAGSGKQILALAAWTNAQAVGYTQVRWPSGHDMVRNVRLRNLALQPDNKVPYAAPWQIGRAHV